MAKSQKERFPSPLCHHLFKGLTAKLRRWDTPREVRIVPVRVLLRYTVFRWVVATQICLFMFTYILGEMIQFDLRICFKWVETTNSTRSRNLWIPMYALPRWIIILFLGPFVPPPSTWYHSPLLTLIQWNSWKSLYILFFLRFWNPKAMEVWKTSFSFKKNGVTC